MAKDLPKTSLLKYFFRWSFKCSNRSTDGECKKRLLFYTKPKGSDGSLYRREQNASTSGPSNIQGVSSQTRNLQEKLEKAKESRGE